MASTRETVFGNGIEPGAGAGFNWISTKAVSVTKVVASLQKAQATRVSALIAGRPSAGGCEDVLQHESALSCNADCVAQSPGMSDRPEASVKNTINITLVTRRIDFAECECKLSLQSSHL